MKAEKVVKQVEQFGKDWREEQYRDSLKAIDEIMKSGQPITQQELHDLIIESNDCLSYMLGFDNEEMDVDVIFENSALGYFRDEFGNWILTMGGEPLT